MGEYIGLEKRQTVAEGTLTQTSSRFTKQGQAIKAGASLSLKRNNSNSRLKAL